MSKIKQTWAREILDSRGVPTVEAIIMLDSGHLVSSSVPTGASTGSHEALELRDGDKKRFLGKGVLKATNNIVNTIGPAIAGMDPQQQGEIDKKIISLDGTDNKSKLGANAILAVSQSVAKAGALSAGRQLFDHIRVLAEQKGIQREMRVPVPLFNMINGGLHGSGNLDFQEFHVIPATSKKYSDGLRAGSEIYRTVGENLKRRGAIHSVGDEGGYAPNLFTNSDAFEIFMESIKMANYAIGRDVFLGLDVAANSFFEDGHYSIKDSTTPLNDDSLLEYYKKLNDQYRLAIIEDAFHEDAWDSWKKITAALGQEVLIVGDDLLATNIKRVEKAIKESACNGILVKPNQIGTISETLDVIKRVSEVGWKIVVSHRSGETNDSFIADFAVGIGSEYMKFGAPARGERIAKYNRLLSIEAELYRIEK